MKKINPDILLCIAAGLLLLISSPGIDIWPAAFAAFAVIFWILDRKRIKAWKAMWLTGFSFYIFALMWISVPVTVFGGAPAGVGFLIAALTAIVASLLFWAPLGIVASRTNNSIVLFALVLVALEMLKGKFFVGGMPWLNIGQSQYNNILTLQLASVVGELGVSFAVVLTGGIIYRLTLGRQPESMRKWLYAGVAAVLILFGYGAIHMLISKPIEPEYTVRLVQTGIAQEDKWDSSKRAEVYFSLITLLEQVVAEEGHYDLMLLPESTFNVNPLTTETIRSKLVEASMGSAVILSHDRYVTGDDGEKRLHNSMTLIQDGVFGQVYDKMKLAPFGEYFPLANLLEPVKQFFFGSAMMFSPGSSPVVFRHNDLRIAPLICFEASFSEIIRERIMMGANVLAVSSNESWFGESLGRHQRYAMDTLRSAEYRRYLLRSTQDGISGVIDANGRPVEIFPEKTAYFGDIRFAAIEGRTIFASMGYSWYAVALVGYAIYLMRKRRQGQ